MTGLHRLRDPGVACDPSALRAVLVVPPGLHPHIYPWGAHLLVDSLTSIGVDAKVVNLSTAAALTELAHRHADLLDTAYQALRPRAATLFFGHTLETALLLGVLARAGERFVDIAHAHRLFRALALGTRRRLTPRALGALQAEYRSIVGGLLRDEASAGPVALWGITTYDYTLVNALHVAELIRGTDPATALVMGGDYFDNRTATSLMQRASWLDGVVVGYGEQTLQQLVRGLAAGRSVREAQLPGLVTPGAGVDRASAKAQDRLLTLGKSTNINLPSAYSEPRELAQLRLARTQSRGRVRVLTQRGCSWGNCTFCSQIDRRMHRALDPGYVLDEVQRALPARPSQNTAVVLDADENDLGIVLPLLETLNERAREAEPGVQLTCEFWLMVRKFGAELPRYLARKDNRVRIKVILNIESLNLQTLRHMKKGVTILESLQAVKAIRDTGHVVETNYFMNYPLERTSDVTREAEVLARIVHLLTPPRTQLSGFSYMANGRDDIYFDPERYEISVGRDPADVWIRELFGADLPLSIWAVRYKKQRPGADLRRWISYAYHRQAMANKTALIDEAARTVLGPGAPGALDRARFAVRHLAVHGWRVVTEVLQAVTGDRAYRRRSAVFDYLDGLARQASRRGQPAERPSGFAQWGRRVAARWLPSAAPLEPSYLVIHRGALIKRYALPGHQASWSRPLDDLELDFLRFLYWRRRDAEVEHYLSEHAPGPVGQAMLARLEQEGVVLRDGRLLLSLANDPGYWQTAAAAVDGPTARTGIGLP